MSVTLLFHESFGIFEAFTVHGLLGYFCCVLPAVEAVAGCLSTKLALKSQGLVLERKRCARLSHKPSGKGLPASFLGSSLWRATSREVQLARGKKKRPILHPQEN